MKRILAVTFTILLCLTVYTAHAEFSREAWYGMGLISLEEMNPDQLDYAMECFDAAGNYQEAKNYIQYILSLQDIFSMGSDKPADLAITTYRLQILSELPDFVASLAEHNLPSCPNLNTYITARQAEASGNYATAWHLYAEINNVLDALNRRIGLTQLVYEQGKEALEQQDYLAAAEALQGLSWRDSDTLYQQAVAAIPTSASVTVTYKANANITLKTETVSIPTGTSKTISARTFIGYSSIGDDSQKVTVNARGIANPDSITFCYIGYYITFGHYEQDNNLDNGKDTIEWQVLYLDRTNNRALVISRYALDCQPYNNENTNVTWETCSLRAWLNDEFLASAFSEDEQNYILMTNVDNSHKMYPGKWTDEIVTIPFCGQMKK